MTRRGAAGAALCMHCEARGDAAQRDMVRPHLLDSIDAGMRMLERAETSSRVGPRLLHRAEHGQLAAQARVLGGSSAASPLASSLTTARVTICAAARAARAGRSLNCTCWYGMGLPQHVGTKDQPPETPARLRSAKRSAAGAGRLLPPCHAKTPRRDQVVHARAPAWRAARSRAWTASRARTPRPALRWRPPPSCCCRRAHPGTARLRLSRSAGHGFVRHICLILRSPGRCMPVQACMRPCARKEMYLSYPTLPCCPHHGAPAAGK